MEQGLSKWTRLGLQVTIGLFLFYFLSEVAVYLLIDFPFNQYEPEVVMDAWALSQGMDLYPPREVGPPAGLYAPFYHIVTALFFQILPDSLLTARLVSILAMLGSVWIIKQSGKDIPQAWLWSFFAIFIWHPNIAEFDMHAKPDSLSVFLGMLSAFFALQSEQKSSNWVWAALISALSVASKQSMLFVPAGIGLALWISKDWRKLFSFTGLFVVFSAIIWWLFSLFLGDGIWFYVFVQPGSFQMRWAGTFINFWYIQSPIVWWLLLLTIPWYWSEKIRDKRYLLLMSVTFLALPASVLTASKGGGLANAYQPFFYFMSWTFIYVIGQNWFENWKIENRITQQKVVAAFGFVILLWFTLRPNIPSIVYSFKYRYQQWKNYEYLAEKLAGVPGSVYVPMDNYLSLKAGKPMRWSYKWQVETPMRDLQSFPKENSFSLALKSDWVITINNGDWTSDTELEKHLQGKGFEQVEQLQMGQIRSYRLWKKPTNSILQ